MTPVLTPDDSAIQFHGNAFPGDSKRLKKFVDTGHRGNRAGLPVDFEHHELFHPVIIPIRFAPNQGARAVGARNFRPLTEDSLPLLAQGLSSGDESSKVNPKDGKYLRNLEGISIKALTPAESVH
jgi:hypothetical protein